MNNAITEIKSTLEGTNSRITEAEDRISEVEDRLVETNEAERKKELKEMRTTSETSGTIEEIKKNQSIMNNTEIKSTLEGTNSRITEAEERISEVEDRMVKINESEREKELKEMRTTSETSGTVLNAPTFES